MSSRHTDVVSRPVRRVLEDEIERLIAMLDELDGDADFEQGEDDEDGHDAEPCLGWSASGAHGLGDDREQDVGDEGEEVCEDEGADRDDAEPMLGWPENDGNPAAYSQTSAHDDEVLSW